jgi:hypothetical protein
VTAGSEYRAREARARLTLEGPRLDREIQRNQAVVNSATKATLASGASPAAPRPPEVVTAEQRLDNAQKARAKNEQELQKWQFAGEQPSPAEVEAWSKPFSYFIGKGVVTQEQIDALVTSHYRWAEAAINMVFPTIFLYIAVLLTFPRVWWRWWLGLVVLALVVLLIVGGQRMAFEYRLRVRELIVGRLEKMKAEENQEVKTIHEALALAQKLLADHKAKGPTP